MPAEVLSRPPQRKMIIGAWSVLEDAQGIFFQNDETQQQSDQVPLEIAHIFSNVTYDMNGQMVLTTARPVQQQHLPQTQTLQPLTSQQCYYMPTYAPQQYVAA
eukprot:TRINITY_DN3876_c0_g2_i4.p1 TRINITY_DN3876_c0_g2~~TRINITY_DN3876_c0_g2_i4.p1  ORF type:complete len:121 (-),score=30.19 TRINITY_DN3876_c0_g2_i4:350-658(-)